MTEDKERGRGKHTERSKQMEHSSASLKSANLLLCSIMTSDMEETVLASCACFAKLSSISSRFTLMPAHRA